MKILISADMEGITGVVHWDQVNADHSEFARFRELMTSDVNAAVQGAFAGGADEVVVSDAHGGGRNLLQDHLDPRVRLCTGSPSPMAMVQGIDTSVDGVLFVGYHARAGTRHAILDHTWSSASISNVRLNDQAVGEIGMNAGVVGHFGVPVVLVSGDQSACAEARDLLGPIDVAVVKHASGRMSAECLSPEASQERIHAGAARAVNRLRTGAAVEPLQFDSPITLSVDLVSTEMADRAEALLGTVRPEGRRVDTVVANILEAYRMLIAIALVARG